MQLLEEGITHSFSDKQKVSFTSSNTLLGFAAITGSFCYYGSYWFSCKTHPSLLLIGLSLLVMYD